MIYTLTLNPAVDRELTVATMAFDEVLRTDQTRIDWDGKGFNVSRMLASLGTPTVAMGYVGGYTGEMLHEGLTQLGIETDFVRVEGETRTNVSIIAATHDQAIKVNEGGPTISAGARTALLERVAQRAQPGDWWVLSGALPPGLPVRFYAELIRVIRDAGAYTVLDTSGEALQQGIPAGPFLTKSNESEVSQLTGLPVDILPELLTAASAFSGVEHVVISLGARGALLARGMRSWFATPPRIRCGNPMGAGDSMVAGLVWALDRGRPLPEVLRWGTACGTATAYQPGTTVGTRSLVEAFANEVHVQAL